MGEKSREVWNDSFSLNMWWNLNILRGLLEGSGQSNLVLLSPAGLSGAYASSLFITQKPTTSPTPLRSENHTS